MLRFLKNIFRKPQPTAQTASFPRAVASPGVARPSEVNVAVPRVETAQLSLAAIMAKFPDELRKLVLKMPSPEAMVVMPLPTIQKLLPTGSVKMSLASVVRQAPPGTFSTINPQDKRMIDVPLAEIFKRIPPALLKKRTDQKANELAAEGFDIFGDDENPHALAPRVEGNIDHTPAPKPPSLGSGPKVLKMPPGMVAAPPPSVPAPFAQRLAASAPAPAPQQPSPTPRVAAAPPPSIPPLFARQAAPAQPAAAAHPEPAAAHPEPAVAKAAPAASSPAAPGDAPPLVIPIKDLATYWPEPIKSEAVALNGAMVALPAAEISAGLARGKVSFAWGQLRSWLTPPPSGASSGSDATELQLPLRVIAPAFLKHNKAGSGGRKAADVGDIPELFAGGNAAPPSPVAPPAPTPEPEPEPQLEAEAPEPEPAAELEQAPAAVEAPAVEAEPVASAPAEQAFVQTEVEAEPEAAPVFETAPAPVEEPAATEETSLESTPTPEATEPANASAEVAAEAPVEAEPAVEVSSPAPVAQEPPAVSAAPASAEGVPQTLGEAFGKPEKTSWVPSEVVKHLSEMPGVVGALVALQEGLVIAHRLPEPFKGEVFAAFLPQIFARLNQYSGEMKLGGVGEILIQANGGPCYLFRRGQVYFAALGQPESTLPIHVLRLCADAVAS